MKTANINFKNFLLSVFFVLCCFATLNSQTNFQWAKKIGSTNYSDRGYAIATDVFGNVYTTGFFSGTADFDPGAGTYTMSSAGSSNNPDIYISKLDVNGNFVWAQQIGAVSSDFGRSIAVDGSGNILVTGSFQGTADFNAGAGVNNLTSFGSNDIFVLKLNALGNFIWAKNMGGTIDDIGHSIATDVSGNVYTTGYFTGTADFDPSVSTFTMNGLGGQENVFISKLDALGNFVWAKQFNGTTGSPQAFGNGIKLDGSGNVYVGGSFTGNIDFDPSAATFSVAAINMDIFISKLDGSGNLIWVKSMGGTGGSNTANSIAIDATNNIYATGYFDQTTDFDPGAASFTITSFGSTDVFILKLDASGNFVWAKKIGSPQGDQGKSIAVSSFGDVYTTGICNNNTDLDPGLSVNTYTSIGGTSTFISRLDASGNFVFGNGFGYSNCSGNGIALDPYFDIYTAGNFDQTTDFDPSPGTFTISGSGGDDIFVHKLGQSVCPTFSINSTTSSYTLMCALNTLTLNAVSTTTIAGVTFTWTAPSLTTTSGSSYTCTAAGLYTVAASAPSNTCFVTQTLSIIQTTGNVSFNVLTNGSTCNNNGTASVSVVSGASPFTYSWSTASTFTAVSNLAPGNYSVTVTDVNSCFATNTFVINNSAPSFSSVPICFVTVDSLSQHNVITWDKTAFSTADSFYIYRETGTNIYKKIQAQPYSAFSQFTDTVKTLYFPNTGNPNVGTYRYKMKTKDNCGNYSTFSPYHNTLFLINTNGTFSWSQLYAIEGDPNPVSAYILERDNLSNGTWQAVGSVAGTQQFVIDPNYSSYISTGSWRVKTQWNINCIPTLKSSAVASVSYSNRITNNTLGLKENTVNNYFNVYPNPTNDILYLQVNETIKLLKIFDLQGREMLNVDKDTKQIDVKNLAKGIYFIELTTSAGKFTKKFVKE